MRPATRRPGQARIVQGPDQPLLAHDVGEGLALVPGVVAQRQAVGAGLEQLARRGLGDAEAARGVLGVDHHEVQGQPPPQARQMPDDALTARAADHVSEEGDTHSKLS